MHATLRSLAFVATLVGLPAESHDFWINRGGYKDRLNGVHCCGPNDCFAISPARITVVLDGYRLESGEVVPFSEAYVSEDRDFWRCQRADGSRRCFFAPPMSF
jgi:hypothetical protein